MMENFWDYHLDQAFKGSFFSLTAISNAIAFEPPRGGARHRATPCPSARKRAELLHRELTLILVDLLTVLQVAHKQPR